MFLGAFERVFKGLQKTGLNRSRQVNVNRFFCGLYISKIKRPDRRSGLLRSWSGLVTVFFRSRDRTSKHYASVSNHEFTQVLFSRKITIGKESTYPWPNKSILNFKKTLSISFVLCTVPIWFST